MATGNMRKKIGEVRPRGFQVMHAERQTNRQTDLSQYFASISEGKVITHNTTTIFMGSICT